VPFRAIAMDHIGPFTVKNDRNENVKVYLLIITCLWSLAVNLIVSRNINNECFLQAIQLHIFEYGVPQRILSDNGSPIVCSIRLIQSILDDADVRNFLKEKNVKIL
jgi:hypothetical protein